MDPNNFFGHHLRVLCALIFLGTFPTTCPTSCFGEIVVFDLGSNGTQSVHGQDLHGNGTAVTTAFGSSFSISMKAGTINNGSVFNLVNQGLAIKSQGPNQIQHIDAMNSTPAQTDTANGQLNTNNLNLLTPEGMVFQLSTSEKACIKIRAIQFEGITLPGQDKVDLKHSNFANTISHQDVDANGFLILNLDYDPTDTFLIRYSGGNGFRINQLILEVDLKSTPEASSFASFGIVMVLLSRVRRRRVRT